MAKFYIISPSGVPLNPVLFPTMKPHFYAAGHTFTANLEDADCFLVDLHTRIADYDQSEIDYVVSSGKPVVYFCEYDRGGMSSDEYPHPLTEQQQQLFKYTENVPNVHFCRLLDKNRKYPFTIYPFEKPIFSVEEPLLSPDELFDRPTDIFFVANSAPQREAVKKAFEEDGRFKCNIVLGAGKIPFNEWKAQCRQAKAFLKISGGGYSCERMQALWATSLMVMEDTDQLLAKPFLQALNCIKIDVPPTKFQLDCIYGILNNPRELFYLYHNQYNFVKQFYSAEYISNNILETIKKHGLI